MPPQPSMTTHSHKLPAPEAVAWSRQQTLIALWRSCSCGRLRRPRGSPDGNRRALGLQEPFLSDAALPRRGPGARRTAAVESLPFQRHPAVADPQSLLFTPTMVLFGWLVPQPSMQLFDIVVFAHLLPGGPRLRGPVPAPRLAPGRRRRRSHRVHARRVRHRPSQHTGIIFSYGVFPVALWLLEEALDRRSYRLGALFASPPLS